MSKSSDSFSCSHVLIVGSFVQLTMSMFLYMVSSIKSIVLIVLTVVMLLCLMLAAKTQNRPSRIVIRVIFWGLPLLLLLFNLFTLFYMLVIYRTQPAYLPDVFLSVGITATITVQTLLMFAMPVLSALAYYQQKRCDIFMARLFAILCLLMALFTCLYVIRAGSEGLQLAVWIHNNYYNIFYCLVCALTAFCAMAAFPFKSRFLSSLFSCSGRSASSKQEATTKPNKKSK